MGFFFAANCADPAEGSESLPLTARTQPRGQKACRWLRRPSRGVRKLAANCADPAEGSESSPLTAPTQPRGQKARRWLRRPSRGVRKLAAGCADPAEARIARRWLRGPSRGSDCLPLAAPSCSTTFYTQKGINCRI